MKSVKVLDCTLRDGGYVNDWMFGTEAAKDIIRTITPVGVDYIEFGFIDNFDTIKDGQIQFTEMSQARALYDKKECKTAIMVNIGYGYPVTKFPEHSDKTVDLIRVVLWDRMIEKGVDYCKALKDKGYEVCVQATHTPQYGKERFVEFVNKYNEVKPLAFYIVDTFGELTKSRLFDYAQMIDDNLDEGIRIGYHAHNNMQQAFSNAVAFCEHSWKHDLMIDASVYGIGRGAGNLCLELFLKYLNEERGTDYDILPLYEVFDKHVKNYFMKEPWGYSLPYMLSAKYGINPNYVKPVTDMRMSVSHVNLLFSELAKRNEGERFNKSIIDDLARKLRLNNC